MIRFPDWLDTKKGEDSPIGDLAGDVARLPADRPAWDASSLRELERGVAASFRGDVADTVREAWAQYVQAAKVGGTYVYGLTFEYSEAPNRVAFVKIGVSTKPGSRMKVIETCSPVLPRMTMLVEADRHVEQMLHDLLEPLRVRGEWYEDKQWGVTDYLYATQAHYIEHGPVSADVLRESLLESLGAPEVKL